MKNLIGDVTGFLQQSPNNFYMLLSGIFLQVEPSIDMNDYHVYDINMSELARFYIIVLVGINEPYPLSFYLLS